MKIKVKVNSPTFLVKADSDEQDFTTTRFAVVTFTPELIERISKLRKTRELANTYEVSDWSSACVFANEHEYAYERDEETITEEQLEAFENFTKDNAGVWNIEPVEEFSEMRTEGDMMYISDWGVKFDAYIKWGENTRIYTETIPFTLIDKIQF